MVRAVVCFGAIREMQSIQRCAWWMGVRNGGVYDETGGKRPRRREGASRTEAEFKKTLAAVPCESTRPGASRGERGRRRECLAVLWYRASPAPWHPGKRATTRCYSLAGFVLRPNSNRRSWIPNRLFATDSEPQAGNGRRLATAAHGWVPVTESEGRCVDSRGIPWRLGHRWCFVSFRRALACPPCLCLVRCQRGVRGSGSFPPSACIHPATVVRSRICVSNGCRSPPTSDCVAHSPTIASIAANAVPIWAATPWIRPT